MKTLYVSDLDGTLLNADAQLSEYAIATLNQLIADGLCFTYATARSLASASVVTRHLRLQCPVIVYNGTFILDASTGEVLDAALFDRHQAAELLQFLIDQSLYPLVNARIDGLERVSYLRGRENPGITAYVQSRQGDKRLRPVDREVNLFDGDIFYFSCLDSVHKFHAVRDRYAADPRVTFLLLPDTYNPSEYWCQFMPARATKGNAILRLKDALQCDHVVTFGDAINDLAMFAIADECYAVENAVTEVKSAATGIIQANCDDGVVRFLAARHMQKQ